MPRMHIVSFNADEYRDALARQFPELTIEFSPNRRELSPVIEEADYILAFGTQMYDELFARNKNLKWIQALGTGVDGIIDQPSLGKDVIVTSMRGIHGPQMTEMAFLMMLAFNRNFPQLVHNQDERLWNRWPGRLLEGKTIGIVGVGLIAAHLAKRCKGFDMTVVGITSTVREEPNFDRMYSRARIAEAVSEVDYLAVLAPYTPETHSMVGAEVFAAMKPTSFLVNIARGGVVDEDALTAALEAGEIGGAGLDVVVDEPLARESPLWAMKNVIITPHMAGMCDTYLNQALPIIQQNLRAVLNGDLDSMVNVVEH